VSTKRTSPPVEAPEGWIYQPNFITGAEEQQLLREFERLDFQPFQYQNYTAKRRVVVYGWDYDYSSHKTSEIDPIPEFLHSLRAKTAEFQKLTAEQFVEAVIHEYPPGAPIGWHRDVPQFEIVAGISLLSACRMRLRPYETKSRKKPDQDPAARSSRARQFSTVLEPRSLYILSGDARWKWQHSIPEVESLRYSITFRTLRGKKQ
jgi:alkylated DNA repair dioxygenase AlkB